MLVKEKVISALESKTDHFAAYQVSLSDALASYEQAVSELATLSQSQVEARLVNTPWPGARPTFEHDLYPNLIVPFEQPWEDQVHIQAWAQEVLAGRPTVAVSGAYMTPTKDVSIPLGAVQIGWAINLHDSEAEDGYVKDLHFEILAPGELSGEDERFWGFSDWRVNVRRFLLECEKLVETMLSAREAKAKPVCFFDGSLILSFVQHMGPERQLMYVEAMISLIETSRICQVPLVGYTDNSYTNDLAAMLNAMAGRRHRQWVSDGALLNHRMHWGDRTAAYICAREDKVWPIEEKYYDQVCFVYLKASSDDPPARLDIPRWLLESGQLDQVVDVVRAEYVLGNRYPHVLETVDTVAVLTPEDREQIYELFQSFAEREHMPLRFSRRRESKRGLFS